MRRYTINGSREFEQKISSDMELIVNRVTTVLSETDLVAIILGGGYGRGEGGIRLHDGKEYLFNDYDLFIISKSISRTKAKAYQLKLRHLSEELGSQMGIEVDFSPIQPIGVLPNADFWMVWYELKYGHIVLWGNPKVLRYLPAWQGENIPVEEAAKLLLNRGVGLHLAKQKIDSSDFNPSDEFVSRNIFKAIMAMGDAILICEKQYHWSYQERQKRFTLLSDHKLVSAYHLENMYNESIRFKLNPYDLAYDKIGYLNWFNEIISIYQRVFYDVFSLLLGAHILDVRTYLAHLNKNLYLQMDVRYAIKNLALNIRDHHGKGFVLDLYFRYPRYRLFYCLPWFLFHENMDLYRLDEVLGLPEHSSNDARTEQFLILWRKYN